MSIIIIREHSGGERAGRTVVAACAVLVIRPIVVSKKRKSFNCSHILIIVIGTVGILVLWIYNC
jgi:uncharacterized membrane protein (DUF373 family)